MMLFGSTVSMKKLSSKIIRSPSGERSACLNVSRFRLLVGWRPLCPWKTYVPVERSGEQAGASSPSKFDEAHTQLEDRLWAVFHRRQLIDLP